MVWVEKHPDSLGSWALLAGILQLQIPASRCRGSSPTGLHSTKGAQPRLLNPDSSPAAQEPRTFQETQVPVLCLLVTWRVRRSPS